MDYANNGTTERVKCAAIRLRNGEIVEGYTHREITEMIHQSNGYEPVVGTEGFVTETLYYNS